MDQPDSDGKLNVNFSKSIKLPIECINWDKNNDGAERIAIDLMTSSTTEDILYDEDLSLDMTWRVDSVKLASNEQDKRNLQGEYIFVSSLIY